MIALRALTARCAGAPDTLRVAIEARLADPSTPRLTRKALEQARAEVEPSPAGRGVVPFVVVDREVDDGLILFAIASDGPRGDLGALPAAVRDRVHTWLRDTWPGLCFAGLHLHVSAASGDLWTGRSCELALGLAALSWALHRAPDPTLVVTGMVGPPGQVAAVAHLDRKRAVVGRDRPGHALVAAEAGPVAPLIDRVIPGATGRLAAQSRRSTGREARRALDALFEARHEAAAEHARRAVDAGGLDAPSLARARWVQGALALHAGDVGEGLAAIEVARAQLPAWAAHARDLAEELTAEELDAWLIVAMIDAGRTRAAHDHAHAALTRLDAVTTRSRRWRHVALQVAGSAHRAAITLGDLDGARRLLLGWSLDRAALEPQIARALGDLAEVERRAGDPAAAARTLDEATDALADTPDDQGRTAAFLSLFRARLDAEAGLPVDPPTTDLPLWPALGFRLLRTRTGHEDLATLHADPVVRASAPLRGVVLSEIAWHLLHDGPGAHLREALRDDARHTVTDDPGLAALLARLAHDPTPDDLHALRRRAPYG